MLAGGLVLNNRLGIGTYAPETPLHIVDSTGSGTQKLVTITNNGKSVLMIEDTVSANNDWKLENDPSIGFQISRDKSGATELALSAMGTLTLRGNLIACSDTSQCSPTTQFVPDYVFEPDYELMPLAELDDYVRAFKHLPGVPTADDVAREGLDVTRMQMKLLEKLEELTLYTLEQERRLGELERQNAMLRVALDRLGSE